MEVQFLDISLMILNLCLVWKKHHTILLVWLIWLLLKLLVYVINEITFHSLKLVHFLKLVLPKLLPLFLKYFPRFVYEWCCYILPTCLFFFSFFTKLFILSKLFLLLLFKVAWLPFQIKFPSFSITTYLLLEYLLNIIRLFTFPFDTKISYTIHHNLVRTFERTGDSVLWPLA